MVADAHLAVGAAIAAEGAGALVLSGSSRGGRLDGAHAIGVGVLELVGALAVVGVDVLALRDVAGGDADVLAVLDDLVALLDVGAGNLVEERDGLLRHDVALAPSGKRVGDVGARLELADGHDDVVLLVNDDAVTHVRSSSVRGCRSSSHAALPFAPWCGDWLRRLCVRIYELCSQNAVLP